MLRRQRAVIIEGILIIGMLAWLFSSLRTPIYQATARVLIEPNDPSETIDTANSNLSSIQNPDRTVSAQLQIMQSIPVADQAAKAIPGATGSELLSEVHAQQVGSSDV